MDAYDQPKKIARRRLECPHCGNDVVAKDIDDEQKCPFCKRKYKIKCTKRGKKFHWEAVAIDYSYEAEGRPFAGKRLERN